MKADDYCKIARELLEKPPLKSTIFVGVPNGEDGPADALDVVLEINRRLISEVKTIADTRKAHTDEAILAIMLELKQRWFAICDRMKHPAFKREIFQALVNSHSKRLGAVVERGRFLT